jgi:hypothetical protein
MHVRQELSDASLFSNDKSKIKITKYKTHNDPKQEKYLLPKFERELKVKVKVALEQATKDQRGSRGITLLFL